LSAKAERAVEESQAGRALMPTSSLPWTRADTIFVGLQTLFITIVYARALRFDFVLDDFPLILQNPLVRANWKAIPRFFAEGYFERIFPQAPANDYRPLLSVWLLVNQKLWGFNPAGWHVAPIFLQAVVTVGVYLLARRLFLDRPWAALAAVVFALHPTHVETTAWVIGMNESLMAVPFLFALLAFLRSRDPASHAGIWLGASLFGYALALCAKEDAIVLPALVAAWAWFFGGAKAAEADSTLRRNVRSTLIACAPYMTLTALYVGVRFAVLGGLSHTAVPIPLATIVWTAPLALWSHLRLLLWPSGLSIFYDIPYVTGPLSSNFMLPAAALAALLLVLWLWAETSRQVSFLAVWLFVPILPLLDLRVLPEGEFVHDRYLYLSSIAFALLVAKALKQGAERARSTLEVARVPNAAAVVLAAVFGGLSFYYSGYWTNNLSLLVRGVAISPGNNAAVNNLANEFVKHGRYGEATALYDRVLDRAPNFWLANYNLGVCDYKMGRYDDALTHLSRAAASAPSEADIFVYAGLSLYRLDRLPEAESALERAITIEPAGAGYHLALGIILKARGERGRALAEFRQELTYHPEESAARQAIAEIESQAAQSVKGAPAP